jgi:hypothetical protein
VIFFNPCSKANRHRPRTVIKCFAFTDRSTRGGNPVPCRSHDVNGVTTQLMLVSLVAWWASHPKMPTASLPLVMPNSDQQTNCLERSTIKVNRSMDHRQTTTLAVMKSASELQEQIRRRAYELYEQGGRAGETK